MNSETFTPETPLPQPPKPAARYPFWSYQDLAVLIGLALPAMVAAALVVRIVIAFLPMDNAVPAVPVLAAQFLSYGFWFFCLWGVIRLRYDKPFWPSLAWVTPRKGLVRYAVYGPAVAMMVGLAGRLLQTPEMEMPMMDLLRDEYERSVDGRDARAATATSSLEGGG